MNHRTRNFFVSLLTAYVLALGATDAFAANRVVLGNAAQTPLSASADTHTVRTLDALRSKVAKDGKIRVIVGVRSAFAPEGEMDAASVAQQRKEIDDMHVLVLKKNPSLKAKPGKVRAFSTIPFMALEVDAVELEALAQQIEITSIEEDSLAVPTLAESVPLIGGTAAWSSGYTGAGQTVAILDTGVDKTHPFLTGKIVSEACYSTNDATIGASSLCPGGVTQSTATGSGVNCDPAISVCYHGTHVAGIAAGKSAGFSGVAKDASLIAIQVFSRFDNVSICGTTTPPCLLTYTSDYNLALERVYLLKDTYNITSVNMSLGGGSYSNQASCDLGNLSTKTAIDNLRSVNIATVISSGNGGYSNALGAPGCISSAISVGNTTKTDAVAPDSNSASFLNLLAPGSAIYSSIPGAAYEYKSGTSMAAPHVAGSWALLKQQNSNLSVADALNLLTVTGTPITDTKNGITKPRIRVDGALNVALNVPPTLTYTSETGYGNVGVYPSSGTASTLFTYKIIYTDTSNIAPTPIRVCIDGICNSMSKDTGAASNSLNDGSYTNGEQYIYSTTLAAGAHSYYFDAARGAATITLPISSTLSGPAVSNLTISTGELPNGDVGVAYSITLVASGGTLTYRWSASGLPAGLSINSRKGVISGTPVQAGVFGFMVTVTDSASATFRKAFSIDVLDKVAPTTPTGLTASAVSATRINLSWVASSDNVGVTGYMVYRDGVLIGVPAGTSFIDTGLAAMTAYSYTVAACDAKNNCSAQSTAVLTATLNATTPPPGVVVAWGRNDFGQSTIPSGLREVVAIASGWGHSLAVKSDGSVAAWGYNSYDQATVPAGLSGVTSVSAGCQFSAALKNDGSVVAWGYNSYGQTTVPAGLSGVTAIAAGCVHAVALRSDGTVVAWGSNTYGQSAIPAGLRGVVAIAAGWGHTVALKNDGTVVAWGYNPNGQATVPSGLSGVVAIAAGGDHTVALKNDGTVVSWGWSYITTIPAGLSGVTAIAAGSQHSLALKSDGTVAAWGGDNYGETIVPAGLSRVTALAAGLSHSLVLVSDMTAPTVPTGLTANAISESQIILSWVASTDNVAVTRYKVYRDGVQVGTTTGTSFSDSSLTAQTNYSYTVQACDWVGHCSALSAPALATTPADTFPPVITPWVAGGRYTMAQHVTLSANEPATIYYTLDGSTPTTASTMYSTAILVNSSMTIKYFGVDTVGNASAVQTQSYTISPGFAVAWGDNTYGQTTVPTGLGEVVVLSGGDSHTVALKGDGTVVAWGLNTQGQTTIPIGLSGVITVATGDYHTVALKGDGTVVAWGANDQGQTTVPAGLGNVVAIAAGTGHTVALKSDGTLVAWGWNNFGQTAIPTDLSGVVAIAVRGSHTLALKNDGTVVAWGDNPYGETTVPEGLSEVVAIAAGYWHSLALKSDGTVVAWGANDQGQTTVPADLSGVASISAGALHSLALKNDGTVVAWGYNGSGQITVPGGLRGVVPIAAGGAHSLAIAVDSVAPTVPATLTARAFSTTQINLTWNASTDNFGVTGYKVYRNGVQVGTPIGTSYSDTGLSAATSYNYTVAACDAAGNCSAQSAAVTGTTKRK